MAIQALPESAIRSLGSGQALTDPVSLIKELIENSLDAQATKISIDVSQNIIDSVQVSDNGYGISPEDRESACVRHCTSKIRCYEDIDNCGTLGFRGEALASAAALSEKLVFITKVEGEQVATECEVGHDGRVKSTKSTRAPVGTTIKVTGFLKTLPVRKQSAIKYASTNLKKIKKLIATYYLSRPQCRFSLKVLNPKGRAPKNKEQDIVYAPSKSVQAAVGVLVGIKTSSTFQWVSTVNEASKIHIEAFLPTPNSDIAQISTNPTCTQYIYVDSRPVSCTRGTLKTVLSLYRSYLKSSFCTTTLSDPFIYLNIICPPNTYDPNVEPAKDDVLFQDTDAVQAAAEDTFIKVYGKLPVDAGSGGTGQKEKPGGNPSSGFKVLLARREEPREKLDKSPETIPAPDDKSNSSVENAIDPAQINSRSLEVLENEPPKELLGPGTVLQGDGDSDIAVLDTPPVDVESPILDRSAVCEINEDNLPSPPPLPLPEEEFELIDEETEREIVRKDITLSNPWTAAKMTASFNSASSRHLSHGNYESPVVQLSPSHHRRRDSNTGKGMGRGDESPSVLQQNTRTPRPSRNRIEDAFGPFLSPPHSSPPRRVSARTSQLEDPQNAGALDSFITRTPQSMTRGAKPRTRPSIGQEKAGIFPLPFSTELPIDLEPPPYSSQSPLFSPKIRRDFVSATTVLHNNLENEDLIMEDVDALAPQNQMATHRKRRASIVEADEGDDLYSRPAPPPRKNKQNPNQNRQNRATTALIIEPLPQESVPKRRRTRDLSLLEIVPLPQDQVVNLVQTIDFQSIQGQSLQDVFDIHKGDSLYNLSASEPTGFSLDVKGLRELMELIISWERRLGIDEDALGAWTVEETDEGWKRISPKQSSESL